MKNFDIAKLAKIHGANNIRFFFPARPLNIIGPIAFTSSDDKPVVVEAKAVERFNRVVADGYKMDLQPLDEVYARTDFYISDFEALCEEHPERFFVMIGAERIDANGDRLA